MGVIDRIVPINKGEWVQGKYDKLNIVRHNGKVWQSKVENNTDEPTEDSENWMFLVRDGFDGSGATWNTLGEKPFENVDDDTIKVDANKKLYVAKTSEEPYNPYTYEGINLEEKYADEIANYNDVWEWFYIEKNYPSIDIKLGDYINFTTNKGYNIKAVIVDKYYISSEVHYIFVSEDVYPISHRYNIADYNNGTTAFNSSCSYPASDLSKWVNSEKGKVPSTATANPALVDVDYTEQGIYYDIPDELKSRICEKLLGNMPRVANTLQDYDTKYDGNASSYGNSYKIFVPSLKELTGRFYDPYGLEKWCPQFELYRLQPKRIIKNESYWTATAYYGNYEKFYSIPSKKSSKVKSGHNRPNNSADLASKELYVPVAFVI